MNRNYQAGVRFERERMVHWNKAGYNPLRTAGSHGLFDLICVRGGDYPVELIQCKVVRSEAHAERLLKQWRLNPPLVTSRHFHQVLEVKVHRKGVRSVTL